MRKRKTGKGKLRLTEDLVISILGPSLLDGDPQPPDDEVEWGRLWFMFGDQLLPQEIRDHPGRRPDAWWKFEAKRDRPYGVGRWAEEDELARLGVLTPDEKRHIAKLKAQIAGKPFLEVAK